MEDKKNSLYYLNFKTSKKIRLNDIYWEISFIPAILMGRKIGRKWQLSDAWNLGK
jgi:hypothetical protein